MTRGMLKMSGKKEMRRERESEVVKLNFIVFFIFVLDFILELVIFTIYSR